MYDVSLNAHWNTSNGVWPVNAIITFSIAIVENMSMTLGELVAAQLESEFGWKHFRNYHFPVTDNEVFYDNIYVSLATKPLTVKAKIELPDEEHLLLLKMRYG